MEETKVNVKINKGGPLLVLNTVNIIHADGSEEVRENRVSFCRCGLSANMPFCDGAHKASDFEKG